MQHKICRMMYIFSKYSIVVCNRIFFSFARTGKRPPLRVRNTEVNVSHIRYTSGRRGNV